MTLREAESLTRLEGVPVYAGKSISIIILLIMASFVKYASFACGAVHLAEMKREGITWLKRGVRYRNALAPPMG